MTHCSLNKIYSDFNSNNPVKIFLIELILKNTISLNVSFKDEFTMNRRKKRTKKYCIKYSMRQ